MVHWFFFVRFILYSYHHHYSPSYLPISYRFPAPPLPFSLLFFWFGSLVSALRSLLHFTHRHTHYFFALVRSVRGLRSLLPPRAPPARLVPPRRCARNNILSININNNGAGALLRALRALLLRSAHIVMRIALRITYRASNITRAAWLFGGLVCCGAGAAQQQTAERRLSI